jgi:hypothetical protein
LAVRTLVLKLSWSDGANSLDLLRERSDLYRFPGCDAAVLDCEMVGGVVGSQPLAVAALNATTTGQRNLVYTPKLNDLLISIAQSSWAICKYIVVSLLMS